MLTAPNPSAPPKSPRSTSVGRVAAVATIIGVFIVATSLLRHDGDIAGLIKFGAGDTVAERTAHVEDVLGRDVATVDLLGHDGSMFFLQALDPFFLGKPQLPQEPRGGGSARLLHEAAPSKDSPSSGTGLRPRS